MSKKGFWKKAGWFIVALLPAALSFMLQMGAAFGVMFVISIAIGFTQYDTQMTQQELFELTQTAYMSNLFWVVALYQVIGVFVFGLWYYLSYGRKKRPAGAEKPGIREIAMIIFLGGLLQVLVSGLLGIVSELFPDLLEGYMEMMKMAGFTEMTVVTFIATVILAPIGEELLCRGIIFRLAGKVSENFLVANCIQALAFGIIHANLVQGIYAFFLGLVLGYIYGKYRNIWVCMLLHGVINCSSIFIDSLWGILPDQYALLSVALICALALILIALIFKLLGNIKPLEDIKAPEKIPSLDGNAGN